MPRNNPNGAAGTWGAEHEAELVRLAATGMSYRGIATAINEKYGTHFTRNSTIGKAGRMRLVKAPAPYVRSNEPRKPAQPSQPRARVEVTRIVRTNANSNAMRAFRTVTFDLPELRSVDVEPRHLSLADLGPGDCRYPFGTGPYTFCGHPVHIGSSYCPRHHFLCREEPRPLADKKFARAA